MEKGLGCRPPMNSFAELIGNVRSLAEKKQRVLLGIAGAPGSGKSTLGRRIVKEIGITAGLVGMDGFHLSQACLREIGNLGRKGAIDTFDAAGFVALMRRLRHPDHEVIYAPEFHRDIEEPVAGAIPIGPQIQLVVVEGNYLLVPESPWGDLGLIFDEVWYCERDEQRRLADLAARHRAFGNSAEEAQNWTYGSDQRNAELIAMTRVWADLVINPEATWPLYAKCHA